MIFHPFPFFHLRNYEAFKPRNNFLQQIAYCIDIV